MIERLLLGPFILVEPWLRHPNWMVRRPAQVIAVGIATIWLAFTSAAKAWRGALEEPDALVRRFSSSVQLREFVSGNAVAKPVVGRICRLLILRLSVIASLREQSRAGDRNFALRLDGMIDQAALRNLLIWQNHLLPSHVRLGASQADVLLVLANKSDNEARLFDLFSIIMMLERVRSFAVFWDEETAVGAASIVMSQAELRRWRADASAGDLRKLPREISSQVELRGTTGGVKLLPQGRKYANDFLKAALPGRLIIAVSLWEGEDGVVAGEIEPWLALVEAVHTRCPDVAFVVLNCLALSQWREWPAHVRFARHQGLTLQDGICLAQIADGYFGVLDIFGLAAHSASRPGVYLPLEDSDGPRAEISADGSGRIMAGSSDRARVAKALEAFAAALPPTRGGDERRN